MKTLYKLYKPREVNLIVILILALAMAMIGCKEEEEKKPTILVKIDKSLYPFLFDKGSLWIYTKVNFINDTIPVKHPETSVKKDSIISVRDTVNIILDTVNVESIEKDTLYVPDNVRYYEYYNIRYHNSFEDTIYNEQLLGYVISRGLNNGGFVLLSSKKQDDKSMNATIVSVTDEMKVENVTYKQVVKMKVDKDQFIKDNYFLYYVDKVGVIRKEKVVNDTIRETWNLKNHTIQLLKVQ